MCSCEQYFISVSILEAGTDFEELRCKQERTDPIHWVTRPLPAKKSAKVGVVEISCSCEQFLGGLSKGDFGRRPSLN